MEVYIFIILWIVCGIVSSNLGWWYWNNHLGHDSSSEWVYNKHRRRNKTTTYFDFFMGPISLFVMLFFSALPLYFSGKWKEKWEDCKYCGNVSSSVLQDPPCCGELECIRERARERVSAV